MASYSSDVKNELARKFYTDSECLKAELIALLDIGAVDYDGRKDFANSNAAIARKVIKLVKKIYPDAKIEVAAVRTKKLRKTMKYFVRIFFNKFEENFLNQREEKIAYLRGAFLAGGSVNRPESYYRLEIVSDMKDKANFLKKIFSRLQFNSRVYARKDEFVTYLCDGDSVCDFLGMIGADSAVERFEVARNLKEVRCLVNRLMNLELACLNKAVDAAQRQLADIRLLKKYRVKVNDKLQESMEIRLKNPSDTVGELARKIFITREGLMHRFKQIHRLAEDIRKTK